MQAARHGTVERWIQSVIRSVSSLQSSESTDREHWYGPFQSHWVERAVIRGWLVVHLWLGFPMLKPLGLISPCQALWRSMSVRRKVCVSVFLLQGAEELCPHLITLKQNQQILEEKPKRCPPLWLCYQIQTRTHKNTLKQNKRNTSKGRWDTTSRQKSFNWALE